MDQVDSLVPIASEVIRNFQVEQMAARDALILGQAHQQCTYNQGRTVIEFSKSDLVVLNVDSLDLLHAESGQGRKQAV